MEFIIHGEIDFKKNESPCNASVQGRPTINAKPLHIPSTYIGTTNADATDTLAWSRHKLSYCVIPISSQSDVPGRKGK